jgi:hypothetical protein
MPFRISSIPALSIVVLLILAQLVGMDFHLVVFYLFESSEFIIANITFPTNHQSHTPDSNYPIDFILLLSSQSHDSLESHPIKTLRAMLWRISFCMLQNEYIKEFKTFP